MRGFFAALIGCFTLLFLAAWAVVWFDYNDISSAEYQITRAHHDIIAACNLGDIDVIGDSTANADLIPSRIGPGLRVLGLGGGTPVELYYEIESLLQCKDLPRAVILEYAPSSFGSDPAFPDPQKTYFWEKSFAFGVVNYGDAMEVLRNAERFDDALFTGPACLLDMDYRIKSALYAVRFPVYFLPELQHHLIEFLLGRTAEDRAVNAMLYRQTLADAGHHFYGMAPVGGNMLDHDAGRADDRISPLTDFYLRRTIQALTGRGIKVFLLEPPRALTSFVHYPAGLVEIYQNYLLRLQSDATDTRLIGNGFQVWGPELFGDEGHLNLRGSLIFSAQTRDALAAAGAPGIAAPAALPDLAYAANAAGWDNQLQPLAARTAYAVSVWVKNSTADSVSLQIHWPGGFQGGLRWRFRQRAVITTGDANALNSGVSLCPDGWIELFLSGDTGALPGDDPAPSLAFSGPRDAAAELTHLTVEPGMWPSNTCRLQPKETITLRPDSGR